jgi:lysozyme family protein
MKTIGRRHALRLGIGASLVAPAGVLQALKPALAQPTATDQLSDIATRIGDLEREVGIATAPADSAAGAPDFEVLKNRLLNVIDRASSGAPADSAGSSGTVSAEKLLGELMRTETAPPQSFSEQEPPSDVAPADSTGQRKSVRFDDSLADEYRTLFDACEIRSERKRFVEADVANLVRFKDRYQQVEAATAVPWYVVGIIHDLECGFDFGLHLHNGDPLTARTWQIPIGRPKIWNPPKDWKSSAVDALHGTNKGARLGAGAEKPSLEVTLFRLEAYNGFGSRWHNVNTPYLWSYSQHYTKGKYYPDKIWNPDRVSKQCGAAVLIKVLVDKGVVNFCSRDKKDPSKQAC